MIVWKQLCRIYCVIESKILYTIIWRKKKSGCHWIRLHLAFYRMKYVHTDGMCIMFVHCTEYIILICYALLDCLTRAHEAVTFHLNFKRVTLQNIFFSTSHEPLTQSTYFLFLLARDINHNAFLQIEHVGWDFFFFFDE